jgi:hypothetical protein
MVRSENEHAQQFSFYKLSGNHFYSFWQLLGILLSMLSFAQLLLLSHFVERS